MVRGRLLGGAPGGQSWSQEKDNTSRRSQGSRREVHEGYRGSMASILGRAHRGISPHVIPARLSSIHASYVRPSSALLSGLSAHSSAPARAVLRPARGPSPLQTRRDRTLAAMTPFVIVHKPPRPSAVWAAALLDRLLALMTKRAVRSRSPTDKRASTEIQNRSTAASSNVSSRASNVLARLALLQRKKFSLITRLRAYPGGRFTKGKQKSHYLPDTLATGPTLHHHSNHRTCSPSASAATDLAGFLYQAASRGWKRYEPRRRFWSKKRERYELQHSRLKG